MHAIIDNVGEGQHALEDYIENQEEDPAGILAIKTHPQEA